jgi:hypothetical protein
MDGVLIGFGFVWMVVGALVGLYVAGRHEPHLENLEAIARAGSLLDYHRALDAYKWKVTVHAHSLLFPLLSILVGLVFPRMSLPGVVASALPWALMASAVVWTAGGLKFIKQVMALGDLLLLASLITTAVGLSHLV